MFVKRFKSYWPLLILLLTVLILFWPVLLHPFDVLYPTFSPYSDTMVIHWPKAKLMADTWQAGQGLPLWNPLTLSGMPLAANQLAMLFYPPAWLFLLLPIEPVFNILLLFHFLLGGIGIFFLLQKIHGLSAAAALIGSLTFVLNGKWMAHAAGGHVSMVGAIGWMPWVVLGTMKLLNAPTSANRWTWSLFVAIILALQMTTHTLPLIYSIYLIGAMTIWYLIFVASNRWLVIKKLWLPTLAIPLIAGLLGAIQLLPLLELTPFSNRGLNLSDATEYALTPLQLLFGLILPSAQGGHEYVIYLGLIPLLLAPFGLTRQNRWTWFYGLLLLFTILFALGPATPVHALFYYLAPGFRWVRTPARMFFVGAIAISALAGFAIDRLRQIHWSPNQKRWLVRLAVVIGGTALMIGLGLAAGFDLARQPALALALFVPLTLGIILLWTKQFISTQWGITLLGVLLVIDLGWFDSSLMHFVSPENALLPGRPAAQYLAQTPQVARIYSPSYSLPAQTAASKNLHLADGVEPVHLAVYDWFMARAGGYNDPAFSVTIPNFNGRDPATTFKNTEPDLKLLGLLNVTHLTADFPMTWAGLTPAAKIGNTYIYRNQKALPRAWVAHQIIPAESDWLSQLAAMPNLAHQILVEDEVSRRYPTITPNNLPANPVSINYSSPDLIEANTKITVPGWLVFSELWYPGWQATVNGRPQPVEKVNGLLRGIYLGRPGEYQVSVTYHPKSVVWGKWISAITLVIVLTAGGWLVYRTKQG